MGGSLGTLPVVVRAQRRDRGAIQHEHPGTVRRLGRA